MRQRWIKMAELENSVDSGIRKLARADFPSNGRVIARFRFCRWITGAQPSLQRSIDSLIAQVSRNDEPMRNDPPPMAFTVVEDYVLAYVAVFPFYDFDASLFI